LEETQDSTTDYNNSYSSDL